MNPFDKDRERLRGLIQRAGLTQHEDALLAATRPSARLFPSPIDDEASLPIGASHFGGGADLRSAEDWPHHGGRPLVFLCQLRLEDFAALDIERRLPPSGLLSFFIADMWGDGDEAMWNAYGSVGAVLFVEDPTALVRVPPPYDPNTRPNDARRVALRAIHAEPELCVPPLEGPHVPNVAWTSSDDFDRYWDDVWMHRLTFEEEPCHRLLGHADMNFNYHMEGTDLLLQVFSDDTIGWEFGDYQPLRFLIAPDDLAARDFSRVRVNGDEE